MKTKLFYPTLMSLGLFVSCTEDAAIPSFPDANKIVKTSIIRYEGIDQTIEDENNITNMQACIFEDGKMTQIYNDLILAENSFNIQVEKHVGTLYILANTNEHIDLEDLKSQNITEEDWLRKSVAMQNNAPVQFYTGSLTLNDLGNTQTILPISLKRGFARFDLKLRTAGVAAVNSITLKNAAQSGTLFTAPSEDASKEIPVNDINISFDSPLITDTPAVFYAYEQAQGNLEISVDAVIDGKPITLTKAFNGDIKRNTIYTVTVRKDVIDVTIDLSFDEWEEGNDTELVPQVQNSLN